MAFTPDNALVWCEIPVTDLAASQAFYEAVFGYETTRDETGPNPIIMLPFEGKGVAGHLYPGKPPAPGTGPTLHLQVPDTVEETLARVETAGGTVVMPGAVEIPPGRFGYATDLDGNSLGLFQPKAA
ncbi:Glyoxalase family protein [Candidatus Rhodobacter oscarellae]|uniref:Glyoxalase family protein n=1 Tax=Candidatus Rhodobacter oscarellae TaxID=1675527 RepID=A0A0J9E688_9RHOB|nr:VOC family protein [Candidatus Rhodobacter lobularis]KMW58171.1 Glyoxalase family protein [Candidatus Rhodobacter lobularis]